MIYESSEKDKIIALIVKQWLDEWDQVKFGQEERRRKPDSHYYLFSLSAQRLRRLSQIYRRRADRPRKEDTAVQRSHDPSRSDEIRRFVRGGYPWSDLSERQKTSQDYQDLRMPGWLPTAIIANILPPAAKRGSGSLREGDAIKIETNGDSLAYLHLPPNANDPNWRPIVPPIEIIDGQHRLWAFDGLEEFLKDYELPVVAFYDLDATWQAYLFYTINIKPKRINPSLAFDLYPILRIQDWLEKSPAGAAIYRETRAQELTEALWSYPESPWYHRINMLGESRGGRVKQAAFIRTLMSSYVKPTRSKGISIGGLFGGELVSDNHEVLNWIRPQQAAFLILVWRTMADEVSNCKEEWAKHLREITRQLELNLEEKDPDLDNALTSEYSLLNTDQGVRGVMQVTNDLCFLAAQKLKLNDWILEEELNEEALHNTSIEIALESVSQQPVTQFIKMLCRDLCHFDWRTSSTPELEEEEKLKQMVYRGSGGYRELRRQLLLILQDSQDELIRNTAANAIARLGYD